MSRRSNPSRRFGIRVLLRLYPRFYRERYGEEITHMLEAEHEAQGGRLRFWMGSLLEHAMAAVAVRLRPSRSRGSFLGDARIAVRTLMRAPAFSIFAVLTLALGIGSTTAVFTVVDRVILRPLPYPSAERLVLVGATLRHAPERVRTASPAAMLAFEQSPGPAEMVAGVGGRGVILSGIGEPMRIRAQQVTADYFAILGVAPALGRLLVRSDQIPGTQRVATLTYDFWQTRFGGDPSVLDEVIELDGEPHTIVGVTAQDFRPHSRIGGDGQIWVPFRLVEGEASAGSFFVNSIARLAPGATVQDLDAHVDRVFTDLYPPADDEPAFVVGGGVLDMRATILGSIGTRLGGVLAAVGLLLLIACVNVASLLLTRGAQRKTELSIRAALGATRQKLTRLLLTEATVLAGAGALLGSGFAVVALSFFRRKAPEGLPRLAEATVDTRILLVAAGIAAFALFASALVPAWRAVAGSDGVNRSETRTTLSRGDRRLRELLVLVETALAVVLVVGSGLLANDLVRIATEDPGFRPDGLVSMRLDLSGRIDSEPEAWLAFWRQLYSEAAAIPGVESAGLSSELPFTSDGMISTITPEGHEDADDVTWVHFVSVGGAFFQTLAAEIVEGRPLGLDGRAGEDQGIVVNQALVDEYWPGESGIGKTIRSGAAEDTEAEVMEVVGIVADVRSRPGVPVPARVYAPMSAHTWRSMDLFVRTSTDPNTVAGRLRELAQRLDPGLPITRLRTVDAMADDALATPRFYTGLFGSFATVALLLALVGVYGTTSYATRARTREIGIRLALGARRGSIVGALVGRTSVAVAFGVLIGLVGAAYASGFLIESLHVVGSRDLATYAFVGATVFGTGVFAAFVPSSRASRVDPSTTLREDAQT